MNKRIAIVFITSLGLLAAAPTTTFGPKKGNGRLEGWKVGKLENSQPPGGAYPFGIKTVVIDAGHGGHDPGCLGITTSKEKDVALAIALKLGKYIQEKTPDVKVIYTRSTDVFVDLAERANIANRANANLFICIHCNTACAIKNRKKVCNEEVFGTETYVMGLHKTAANLRVQERENEAIQYEKNQSQYKDIDPNNESAVILHTMQQAAFIKQSTNFAAMIQKHVKEKAGRVDKSVQQAGFLVLWKTSMPSVLIETEFLSNSESEKFVVSEAGQAKMAWGIFTAFREYKDEVEGKYRKYDDEENTLPVAPKDTAVKKEPSPKPQIPSPKEQPKKDSVQIKKEPVIENEMKNELASKDSSPVKNEMMPPVNVVVKDTAKNDPVVPIAAGDVVYKVQFMSSGQRVPMLSDKFKGLKDVGEYEDGGSYKYTAGEFKTMDEAMKYRKVMMDKGIKDCFVVKFKDGKRMKNNP